MDSARGALALALCCMATVVGCGGGDDATDKGARSRTVTAAPAYRGGQYCFAKREQQYRAAGYTCRGNHLRRR